jgi:hypothetical protein
VCTCPPFSSLDATASSCVCDAAYYLSNGNCYPCAANAYKPSTGDQACTPCQGSSQIPPVFQPGNSSLYCQCVGQNEVGSSCLCDEGYYRSATGVCTVCASNAYKSGVSDVTSCTPCGGAAQVLNPPGTKLSDCACTKPGTAADGVGGCFCAPGFGYDTFTGACIACGASSYKDTTSNTACVPCPLLARVSSVPAVNASQCTCPPYSVLNGLACECTPGYAYVLCRHHTFVF